MISSTFIKLSAPFARTSLICISISLLVISGATIHYAMNYPYLLDSSFTDLYLAESSSIASAYTFIAVFGIVVGLSTSYAAYKPSSNYIMGHAGLVGIFVPALIVVYFTTVGSRYNPEHYIDEMMLVNYDIKPGGHKIVNPDKLPQEKHQLNEAGKKVKKNLWTHIDSLQKGRCCGVEKSKDWEDFCYGFIPKSCCDKPINLNDNYTSEGALWSLEANLSHEDVDYCKQEDSEREGCLDVIRDDERDKIYRLGILLLLMGIISIADTIVSLLSFALTNTDVSEDIEEKEMDVIETSSTADGVVVTSVKPRPSISAGVDNVSVRAQAVRFNLASSPRQSISGPSKFSAAARRGSSFI